MLQLLFQGQIVLFLLFVIALVISLTFHEFGHAATAKLFGDDTAQRAGRLTLNPLAHIDPMGLLMVVMVGFGYAKPVPTNPNNFRSRWADLWVSAAGPGMNLLLAIATINGYMFLRKLGLLEGQGAQLFAGHLVIINLVLMVFNLIPLGALDGHYILPYFLNRRMAAAYLDFNARYGNTVLLLLMAASLANVPVFSFVQGIGYSILPWI